VIEILNGEWRGRMSRATVWTMWEESDKRMRLVARCKEESKRGGGSM
jgi:GH24 family phage-related lysozyme (muramidase)